MSKATNGDQPAPLLNTEQVADWLQVDPKTVRALVYEGKLPAIRLGARVLRFDRRDVEALIENARTQETPRPAPTGRVSVSRSRAIVPLSERTDLGKKLVPWTERRDLPSSAGHAPGSRRPRAKKPFA